MSEVGKNEMLVTLKIDDLQVGLLAKRYLLRQAVMGELES